MSGATFLAGDSVTLRTIEEEDLPFLQATVNDPAVRRNLTSVTTPLNAEQEREFFDTIVSGEGSVNLLVRADGDRAGTVALSGIDRTHGTAEIGLWIAPDAQGRGYGTEASALLTGYAFDELRLHRVLARAAADNEPSRRIWEGLGFEQEGVHREAAYLDGAHRDLVHYGILAREWRERA